MQESEVAVNETIAEDVDEPDWQDREQKTHKPTACPGIQNDHSRMSGRHWNAAYAQPKLAFFPRLALFVFEFTIVNEKER